MSPAENKALIQHLVHEVWDEASTSAVHDYFAAPLRPEVLRHHAEILAALSGVRVHILDLIAEGDTVAARLMVSGTHDKGPFAGQPPTQKRLAWGSFRFYRIEGQQVVETWAMQERLGLMQQPGLVPTTVGAVHWAAGAAE